MFFAQNCLFQSYNANLFSMMVIQGARFLNRQSWATMFKEDLRHSSTCLSGHFLSRHRLWMSLGDTILWGISQPFKPFDSETFISQEDFSYTWGWISRHWSALSWLGTEVFLSMYSRDKKWAGSHTPGPVINDIVVSADSSPFVQDPAGRLETMLASQYSSILSFCHTPRFYSICLVYNYPIPAELHSMSTLCGL